VRHAATAWTGTRYCGTSDPPLTEAGARAAVETATRLARLVPPGTAIVTSPLQRAVATARAIGAAIGSDVTSDERWREIDFGDVEGLTWSELETTWPDLAACVASGAVDLDWPGGDTAADVRRRVDAALDELLETPQPVIVVTHGGPIRLVLVRLGEPGFDAVVPAPGAWVTFET
ncbi:MAG: histidine phosphatase family protein, partial [Chloroflexota bacterium]